MRSLHEKAAMRAFEVLGLAAHECDSTTVFENKKRIQRKP
jgi:uncharacterized protein (DUF1810 family)